MDRELLVVSSLSLLYFLGAAVNKILNFNDVVSGFIKQTTPLLSMFLSKPPSYLVYQLIIVCVIILQLAGSLIVLAAAHKNADNRGLNIAAKYVLYALIIFSIMATLLYHAKLEKREIIMCMANTSVVAGLWLLSERFNK
jgi:hypothetical protein